MEALVGAIHRCNQLRLPIMVFGAGLPKILKTMGDAKSYTERLFRFEEVDALTEEAAEYAVRGAGCCRKSFLYGRGNE